MTADLFSYTEEELVGEGAVLTYYEILGVELHASQDHVKKAFRRLSLRYHPDKTQRGEDDYVFRAVKAAYDTLYDPTKRQAYDSTKVPFDDNIPGSNVAEQDFFDVYGPVFERNLRFDARLRPELKSKSSGGGNNKRNSQRSKVSSPPILGNVDTPISEVNEFYSYWIHFESWRDFSAQATEELQVENHLENAESRDERRWLQREVEKRAKQLKKLELNRIQTLVERAMESDPRLKRHRALERQRKQDQEAERQRAVQEQKRLEQERKLEQELKEQEERERQATEKAEREKEKKLLRKARQQLRRMTSSMEEAEVTAAVDVLCSSLSLGDLVLLNETFESKSDGGDSEREVVELIRSKAREIKRDEATVRREEEKKEATPDTGVGAQIAVGVKPEPTKQTWTKDELSALAKGVKKYPAGSINRWDSIANFVNHSCVGSARTKGECVEKYNQIRNASGSGTSNASQSKPSHVDTAQATPKSSAAAPATSSISALLDSGWTQDQDQLLQDGLAQFPATMDKNERWDCIAKCVPGKSKKECVQRFKTIREALLLKTKK